MTITISYATQLLHHLATCHRCIAAKITHTPRRCEEAARLVRATLKERHG